MGSGATCSLRHTICVSAGSTSDSWCSFVCTSSNGMYVSMHRSIRTCARCTSLTVVERQLPVAGSRAMSYPPASDAASGPQLDALDEVHALAC